MDEVVIMTVRERTWTKYGKYRAVLALEGQKDRVCWLTQKQMTALEDEFSKQERKCGKRWSNKQRQVIGCFDGNSYRFCKAHEEKQERVFKVPRRQDLSDLQENEDGVSDGIIQSPAGGG